MADVNPYPISRANPNAAVLVVEDQAATRRALAMLLRLSGFATSCFASGEEALRRLTQGIRPTVAVIDLDLPGMNGLEVINRLRQFDARIFPVLLTAADAERVRRGGADQSLAYLQKPVNFEQLLAILNEHAQPDCLAFQ